MARTIADLMAETLLRGRRQAHLRRRRRLAERLHRFAAPHEEDRLGPHAPRGSRRLRRRRRGPSDRRARRLRRKLRARQHASDQRPVRLLPQPRAGARHRRAYPERRDRRPLFPGDASGAAVRRVLRTMSRRSPIPSRCRASSTRRSGSPSPSAAWRWSSFRATSRCRRRRPRPPSGSRPSRLSCGPSDADLDALADLLNDGQQGHPDVRRGLRRRP